MQQEKKCFSVAFGFCRESYYFWFFINWMRFLCLSFSTKNCFLCFFNQQILTMQWSERMIKFFYSFGKELRENVFENYPLPINIRKMYEVKKFSYSEIFGPKIPKIKKTRFFFDYCRSVFLFQSDRKTISFLRDFDIDTDFF